MSTHQRIILFDAEANGLMDTATQIHCIVCKELQTGRLLRFYDAARLKSDRSFQPQEGDYPLPYVKKVLENSTTLIGHNIIGFDYDLIKKFLGLDLAEYHTIDTLLWSQVLNPDRKLPPGCPTSVLNPVTGLSSKVTPHSVESWGYRVAKAKPFIGDWRTFTPAILHRCTEDVLIQEKIFYALCKEAGIKPEEAYK